MLALIFLVTTVMAIYIKVLLLRIWMQWARCDFYNPFSQFVVKITQPVVKPLRRMIFLYLGLVILVKAAGVLVFWVIIVRSLMSWISQGRNPVDYVLIQLTEPLMAPVRRIIPAMGGIDFSAMAVILILYMLNFLGLEYIPGWAQF